MSNRAKLRDLASEFRQSPASEVDDPPNDGVDLDAEIAKRLAKAQGTSDAASSTPPKTVDAASTPDRPEPSRAAATRTTPPSKSTRFTASRPASSADATAPVPRPVVREPGERSRIAVDVPIQFEHVRTSAKKLGMSATALVLAALDEHGEVLASRASEGLLPVRREAVKRWTLLMTDEEAERLDRLVDDLELALGRKSRSAVVGLLMNEASD